MKLREQIDSLYEASCNLMAFGSDAPAVYCEDVSRLHSEVYAMLNSLYASQHCCTGIEEEASLCLALLTGYRATFIDHGEKQARIQSVLDRCWRVLNHLPSTPLKRKLLTVCYDETQDESLLEEM